MCMHTFVETVAIKDEGRPRERMTHAVIVGWKSRNSRADVPFPPPRLYHRFFPPSPRFDLASRIRALEIQFGVKAVGEHHYGNFRGNRLAASLVRWCRSYGWSSTEKDSLCRISVSVVTTKTKVVVEDEWDVLEYEMWQGSKANSVFLKVARTRQYSSIFPSPACEIQRLYIEAKNSKTASVHFSTLHESFVWRLPDHLVSSKTTPKVDVNSREPSFENKD